ncbi:MAG: MerR family transcriptional regulator [Caulobacter sp.]|nr:MerR family transcriptional regulator [Caulobacter sp.]
MRASPRYFSPSEAAARLGVSAKALRLYEQRGLVAPLRTSTGWRTYGPEQMERADEIVALRALGFSLAQIARVLGGDLKGLEPALAAHQAVLEERHRALVDTLGRVRAARDDLGRGGTPALGDLTRLARTAAEPAVAFDLPWPWGGERFELLDIRPLTFIVGPLGSGKTRLAQAIAASVPDGAFVDLDRTGEGAGLARPDRVDEALAWLVEDGATASPALVALLAHLESDAPGALVIDLVEQGLDQATQEALIAYLRRRGPGRPPLFLMTRSSSILDLAAMTAEEAILFCPANHSPPLLVGRYPGAQGYEAVASCLGSPEARARTEGMIAWRPQVA